MRHARTAQLERASARAGDRFRFRMTLATEGEASDGHILSIKGGEIPERFPLLAAHDAYSLENTLGSVVEGRKDLRADPARLEAIGEISLDGEGDRADARRDVAAMIEAGDLAAVSIRWESIESVRRINLPSDHPAFVDGEKEPDLRKRYGLFFKKWRALEGSVVPIGADAAAKISLRAAAWAERGRDGVASFVRSLTAPSPDPQREAVELVAEGIRLARSSGVPTGELLEALASDLELGAVRFGEETHYAARAVLRELGRLTQPSPAKREPPARGPLTVADLGALLSEHDKRLERNVERMIARVLGVRGKR